MSMNIKEAKEQIKNAIVAYFSKDEFGHYVIPIERQHRRVWGECEVDRSLRLQRKITELLRRLDSLLDRMRRECYQECLVISVAAVVGEYGLV